MVVKAVEDIKAKLAKERAEIMDAVKRKEIDKDQVSRHWKQYVLLWYEALKKGKRPEFDNFEDYINNEFDKEHHYQEIGVMDDFASLRALEAQEERGRMWKHLPNVINETKM